MTDALDITRGWKEESDARRQKITAGLDALSLQISAVFIPWSNSRSFKPNATAKDRSLNWKITILHGARELFTCDYTAGIAHCPSYKQNARWTVDYAEAIQAETETGRPCRRYPAGQQITPDRLDVFYSITNDAQAINYPTFEQYAADLDMDADSRAGEATYRECLRIALALRAAVGETGLQQLQEAFRDY